MLSEKEGLPLYFVISFSLAIVVLIEKEFKQRCHVFLTIRNLKLVHIK